MADPVEEFLSAALAGGPCVGIVTQEHHLPSPTGVEVRTVAGARTTRSLDLMDAFAEVWHFPPWFGRNWRPTAAPA